MVPVFNRRNLDFILFQVLEIEKLCQLPCFSGHDADTFAFTLDTAESIGEKILRPAFTISDREPPVLENGQVKVHPLIHDFVKAYADAGLLAAPFPENFGGSRLPKSIAAAAEFILGAYHNSFIMFTDLVKGAAGLIEQFGNEKQKQFFLPKMLSGQWLATMCLTEPQAGSSLSDIAAIATPQSDGTYRIKGQKIFISAGDHDISENIIHLVLARTAGAPAGSKGISLFIVPKMDCGFEALTPDYQPVPNDVTSVAIYHKMGQKATPALHLEFGAAGRCTGYLLGEINQGLPQMFQMMNSARLGVGNGGLQIASAAYHAALQYARERPQGRRAGDNAAGSDPVPIICHADVRRMLLQQQAVVESGICLVLQCYLYLDLEKAHQETDPETAGRYRELLDLLTPVAKTWGAEMGYLATHQALQVFGGYGYTEDFKIEQLLRDCRIMSLYEGTTGIQSLALLVRQVLQQNAAPLKLWQETVSRDRADAPQNHLAAAYWEMFEAYCRQFMDITAHLLKVKETQGIEVASADANLYMEAFGLLNAGWQWLRQANTVAAIPNAQQEDFFKEKIRAMQFFFHYEMPRLQGLFQRLADTTVLTVEGRT